MPAHLSPENLERALELQRKCWTHERIAEELGVHRTTVTRSLSRHNRQALKRLEKRIAATKAQQIAQLEWMTAQAVAAWERSLADEESIKTVQSATGTETTTTIKVQSGNPALIREARSALADVRKILGLDAPPAQPAEPEKPNDDFEIEDIAPPDPPQQTDASAT